MERSVALIVAGGLVLVAGLWIVHLAAAWPAVRYAGVALVLAGVAGLGAGIAHELTAWRFAGFGRG